MSRPDAPLAYQPDPIYIRFLIHSSGLTQAEAATLIGVTPRAMRRYLSATDPRQISYSCQFCLEALAGVA